MFEDGVGDFLSGFLVVGMGAFILAFYHVHPDFAV